MTAPDRKRLILLAAILVVGAVLIVFRYKDALFGSEESESAGPVGTVAQLDERLKTIRDLPSIPLVRPPAEDQFASTRSLFDFTEDPQAVALRKAQAEEKRKAEEARAEAEKKKRELMAQQLAKNPPPQGPPEPPPQPPLQPPPQFRFSYIGYIKQMKSPEEWLAILISREGKDQKPVTAKVGDVLDDRFVIKKIDLDSLTVGFTEPKFRDQTQIVKIIPVSPVKK